MSRSARSGLPSVGGGGGGGGNGGGTTENSAVGDLLDLTGGGGGIGGEGDAVDLNGRHLPPLPPSCHNTAPLSSSAASLDRFSRQEMTLLHFTSLCTRRECGFSFLFSLWPFFMTCISWLL